MDLFTGLVANVSCHELTFKPDGSAVQFVKGVAGGEFS
jgi:hypothetical protein